MTKIRKDLTGQKFGMLTVLGQAEDCISPKGRHITCWLCQCDCGSEPISVRHSNLKKKEGIRNCGCLAKQSRIASTKARGGTQRKFNKFDIESNDYGIGWTTNTNKEFYFDLDDYDLIKQYAWYEVVLRDVYHEVRAYDRNSKKHINMFDLFGYYYPDHINRNPMDNRRNNLRPCTPMQNSRNIKTPKNNTSGVIGVEWHKAENKWRARIMVDGKRIELGQYANKDDAIRARLKGEKEYFKEFAPQKHLYEQYGI